MHVSVMPVESMELLLRVKPDGVYLDATTGLGGHTGLIARQLTSGAVIANDHDLKSLEMARAKVADFLTEIHDAATARTFFKDHDSKFSRDGFCWKSGQRLQILRPRSPA